MTPCDHDGHCSGQTRTSAGHHTYLIICDRCKAVTRTLSTEPYSLQPILGTTYKTEAS